MELFFIMNLVVSILCCQLIKFQIQMVKVRPRMNLDGLICVIRGNNLQDRKKKACICSPAQCHVGSKSPVKGYGPLMNHITSLGRHISILRVHGPNQHSRTSFRTPVYLTLYCHISSSNIACWIVFYVLYCKPQLLYQQLAQQVLKIAAGQLWWFCASGC